MLLDVGYGFGLPFAFVTRLPLYDLGFVWVFPAVIGGMIGALIPGKTEAAPQLIGPAQMAEQKAV